jgi:hypothetical protein
MFTPLSFHPTTVLSVVLGLVRSRGTAVFARLSPRTISKEWPIATWSQWTAAGGVGLMLASLLLGSAGPVLCRIRVPHLGHPKIPNGA